MAPRSGGRAGAGAFDLEHTESLLCGGVVMFLGQMDGNKAGPEGAVVKLALPESI
jgi:hypothetical protein